jgi:hypothetical protein
MLNEVRYGEVVALLLSAFVVFRIAPPRIGVALAGLVLVVGALMADRTWTETLLFAAIAVMVWSAAAGRLVPTLSFALLLSLKQHMLMLAPLAMWWPVLGPTRVVVAGLLAGLTLLPWLLADPGSFLDDTLWFHLRLDPRDDSLSAYALLTRNDIALPSGIGALLTVTAVIGAMGAAIVRMPRTTFGFVIASAFVLFTFNLINKQSFYNHHALVVDLLILGVALAASVAQHDGVGESVEASRTNEGARAHHSVPTGASGAT